MIPTISLITTTNALGIGSLTNMAVAISLLLLLTTKEIADCSSFSSSVRIARFASVYISPLLIAFVIIVTLNVIYIFS